MSSLLHRYSRAAVYLTITDAAAFVAAFGVAMRLRFRPYINVIELRTGELIPEAAVVALLSLTIVPAVFYYFRLYQRRTWLSRVVHGWAILRAVATIILGYMGLQFLTRWDLLVDSRLVIGMWGTMSLAAIGINRLFIFPALLAWAIRGDLARRVAVVGVNDSSRAFARQWAENRAKSLLRVVGFIDDTVPPGEVVAADLVCLGPPLRMEWLADLHNLEGAILIPSRINYEDLIGMIEQCLRVFGWVDVHADQTAGLQANLDPDTYFDIPFIRMHATATSGANAATKRLFDVALAALGMVALSPVFLVVALLVRLTSPGPVLYVTERLGRGGRPFRFYKFRTMVVGADRDASRLAEIARGYQDIDAPMPTKCVDRSKLTPIGGWLRKWALDEMPQLFNVLKGDMSLVGPRPLPRAEYDLQAEWQKRRFDIKPGCTGLWKVYAGSNPYLPYSHSVLYDIYYAKNANVLLDIAILVKTAWVILLGRADGMPPSRAAGAPNGSAGQAAA